MCACAYAHVCRALRCRANQAGAGLAEPGERPPAAPLAPGSLPPPLDVVWKSLLWSQHLTSPTGKLGPHKPVTWPHTCQGRADGEPVSGVSGRRAGTGVGTVAWDSGGEQEAPFPPGGRHGEAPGAFGSDMGLRHSDTVAGRPSVHSAGVGADGADDVITGLWTATLPQAAYLPRAARPVRGGSECDCRPCSAARVQGALLPQTFRNLVHEGSSESPGRDMTAQQDTSSRAGSIQAANEENQPQ